jgi:signal transduction histidine kinase/CheY-like chemotaxis protein
MAGTNTQLNQTMNRLNEDPTMNIPTISYQLDLIAKYAYYDTAFHAASVLIIVLFYWPINTGYGLIAWTISLSIMLLIRCYANWRFRRNPRSKLDTWGHLIAIITSIIGIIWGCAGYRVASVYAPIDQIPITLLIACVTASSIVSLANYLPAYRGFTIAAILPICFSYLINLNPYGLTACAGALIYLIALLFWGKKIHQSTLESIRLKLSNDQLVTELLQQKTEAEEAQHKAEAANVAKSKFLASASHDLRQPLHAMGLLLHALEDRLDRNELITIVQQIENSHQDMEKLFTALLDVSKLDAGVVDVNMKTFSAEETLITLEKEFGAMTKEYHVTLSVATQSVSIRSDPVLLMRILRNLINNAIVHSDSELITVDCTVKPKAIDIHVRDTGTGIPKQEINQIFAEFHQLRNPERDQSKGLGLGLAIVKRLCALLGHDISVRSTMGEGTTFSVTIARAQDQDLPVDGMATIIPITAGHLGGTKILIIDDDRRIVSAMQELLNRWGIQSRFSQTPEEALAILANGFNPDIAICDYRLRENITGVEVLHTLDKKLGRKLPALLITGDTGPERIKEAHTSGWILMALPSIRRG